MRDVVEDLCAIERRGACTDAERRAALWVHDDLRSRGYDPWVETVWVRPQWAWAIVWHAVLGVAVSLVSTAVPVVAVGAVVLAVSWAAGLLRRLFYRRATEIVVVDPDPAAVSLWLVAHTDAPRCGAGFRERLRRIARRVDASWLLVGLLLAVAVCGGLRQLGIEDAWLGILQMVPTVGLLAFVGVALDSVLTDWSPGASDAAGVAVALALHEELTRRPPDSLSVGLVVAGAGEAWPLGFERWRKLEKRSAADTVIVELGPCGSGTLGWSARHPQLVEACGPSGRLPLARPTASTRMLPSLYVRCVGPRGVPPRVRSPQDTPEATDEAAMEAAYDFVLAAVDRLDAMLASSSASASGSSVTSSQV